MSERPSRATWIHANYTPLMTPSFVDGGRRRWRQRLASVSVLLAALATVASPLRAQDVSAWRTVQEVGGIVAGRWMEGPRIPTVSSNGGLLLALGMQRAFRPDAYGGAMLRLALQPVTMNEAGASWDVGTVREASIVGTLSVLSASRGNWHVHAEANGGAAVLNGASNVLPFLDAESLSPLGEVGLSVRRGSSGVNDDGQRRITGFARYGALRLSTTATNSIATSGWVRRITIGLRMSQ